MSQEQKKIFTLSDVTRSLEKTIQTRYTTPFWVSAEMNKLNFYTHSGHAYPDLVEREEGKIKVQMRATLWRDDFIRINKNFLHKIKEPLKDGIKILFLCKISYQSAHGLALNILDIDPSYTLGDLELEKIETITKLKQEGVFELNRQRKIPMLVQKIAVISVETSKGYADFSKILLQNVWGYSFSLHLFPSLLQGDGAVKSIINTLKHILTVPEEFDAVAIIRGGGGEIGLTCYNNYDLARAVATYPIPIFTGIGHATNQTVTEMVSRSEITPSKIAEGLIQYYHNFAVPLKRSIDVLIKKTSEIIALQNNKLNQYKRVFSVSTKNVLQQHLYVIQTVKKNLSDVVLKNFQSESQNVDTLIGGLFQNVENIIQQQRNILTANDKSIDLLHPNQILQRGYALLRKEGKIITKVEQLLQNDEIEITLNNGKVIVKVKELMLNKY